MRVMVGVIILYDHVHPVGAFAKTSKIDVSGHGGGEHPSHPSHPSQHSSDAWNVPCGDISELVQRGIHPLPSSEEEDGEEGDRPL